MTDYRTTRSRNAIVIVDGDTVTALHMKPDPLHGDWAFALTSQNLDLKTLLGPSEVLG